MQEEQFNNEINQPYIRLAEAERFVPYSKDYLSLLARQGKIHAKKIGRDWHTTREAIEQYHSEQEARRNVLNTGRPPIGRDELRVEVGHPVDELRQHFTDESPAVAPQPQAQELSVEDRRNESFVQRAVPSTPSSAPFGKGFGSLSLAARIAVPLAALMVIFGGVRLNQLDEAVYGVKDFIAVAQDMQEEFVRVIEGKLLRVDEGGNLHAKGNVNAGGQLVSNIVDGVAPLVVRSSTTVSNLSAEYLDGIRKGGINLAFVTANGASTATRLVLSGGADIASLAVSGTADVASIVTRSIVADKATVGQADIRIANVDTLQVDEGARLSDTEINGTLSVSGTTNLRRANVNGRLSVDGALSVAETLSARTVNAGGGTFNNIDVENVLSFSGSETVNLYKKIRTDEAILATDAGLEVAGNTTLGGMLSLAGDFVPVSDNTHSIGSAELRWEDIFLGPLGASIYNANGTDAEYVTIGYQGNVFTVESIADGAGTARNFNLTGGMVGIGTADPQSQLHVNGVGSFGDAVTVASATRALNLISSDATMRVWRKSDAPADDPAVELITSAAGSDIIDHRWDFFLQKNSGSFAIRQREYNQASVTVNRLLIDGATGQVRLPATGATAGLLIGGDASLYRSAANVLRTDSTFIAAGQLQLPTTGSSAGILLGGDVNLYRTASNRLNLGDDDILTFPNRASANDVAIETTVSGDAFYRFQVTADGTLQWGPGNALRDTNLYRDTFNTLRTDDSFEVGGDLTVTGDLSVFGITANNGDVVLGDTAADTITFVGVVNSNILPDADVTRDLGSLARQWNTVYANTVAASNLAGTVVTGDTSSASWLINSDNATANAEVSTLAFDTGTNPFNATLQWNAAGDAGRISGFDDTLLFNYPIAIYSEVSGGNQTFTSGTLFSYSQNATHAITQSGAFTGINLDFSSNITVPDSANGNQTGVAVTLSDGGASATATGLSLSGTADYGINLSSATIGTAAISLPTGSAAAQGIDFGGDTNLYRSAANVLRTDDSLVIGTDLTISGTFDASSSSGSFDSLTIGGGYGSTGVTISNIGNIQADGTLTIGADVSLSRGAANRLDLASGDSLSILSGDFTINSDQFFVQQSTGRIGIGTNAPATAVHILGQVAIGDGVDPVSYPNRHVYINQSFTDTSGVAQGIYSRVYMDPTGDSTMSGIGGQFLGTVAPGNPHEAGYVAGVYGTALTQGSGTLLDASGVVALVRNHGTGDILEAYGLYTSVGNSDTGEIANIYGIYVDAPWNTGGGTLGSEYGVVIAEHADYSLWVEGGLSRLDGQLQLPTAGSSAGILLGGDVQLYRGAANRLDLASGDNLAILNGDLRFGTTSTGIRDGNDNELLTFTVGSASALNYVDIQNAGNNTSVKWTATGDDTNITWDFRVKGTNAAVSQFRWYAGEGSTQLAVLDAGGQLELPTVGSSAGILIGGDVQLYRGGANRLDIADGDSLFVRTGHIEFGTEASTFSGTGIKQTSGGYLVTQSDAGIVFTADANNNDTNAFRFYQDGTELSGSLIAEITSNGELALPTAGSGGGVVIGGDARIYRGAANRLDLASGDSLKLVSGSLGINVDPPTDAAFRADFTSTATSGNAWGGRLFVNASPSSASSASFYGAQIGTAGTATANITGAIHGARISNFSGAAGGVTITTAEALQLQAIQITTGATITNARGLNVQDLQVSGGSVVTHNYGIYVSNQTAGTNDYGIAIAGADTQALWVGSGADNTDAANGIAFGASRDTNLYRGAANFLATDDNFQARGGTLNAGIDGTTNGTVNVFSGATSGSTLRIYLAENADTNLDYYSFLTSSGDETLYLNAGSSRAMSWTHTASAVNRINVTGGAAGNAPILSAAGLDTDINIQLTPKGTGDVVVSTGQLQLSEQGSSAGLLIGGDVQLYRSASDILRLGTDDILDIRKNSVSSRVIQVGGASDANTRFNLWADGSMFWGNGTDGTDVQLSRGAANRLDLASGDSFNIVSGTLSIGTATFFQDSASSQRIRNTSAGFTDLRIGTFDSEAGIISLAAPGTGSDGGEARFYLNGDHDTNREYAYIQAQQDDLRIGYPTGPEVARFSYEGLLSIPTTGSSAGVLLGGDAQLYRGASNRVDLGTGDSLYVPEQFAVGSIAPQANRTALIGRDMSASSGSSMHQLWVRTNNLSLSGSYNQHVGVLAVGHASGTTVDFDISGTVGVFSNIYTYGHAINVAGGTVTNASSVYIASGMTGATNNYALFVDAGDTRLDGQLQLPTTGSSAGLLIGGDTNLYRSAANTLKTDDSLVVAGTAEIEGYAAIGNGSAPDANKTLIVDRDFSSSAAATLEQLQIRGNITSTGASSMIHFMRISPDGATIDGVNNVLATSLTVREPIITLANLGTVTTAATLYVENAPTEGTNNYALFVDAGDTRLDGQLQLPTTGSSAGLLIGGDTQLYRGAANRLDLASGDSLNIVEGSLSIDTGTGRFNIQDYTEPTGGASAALIATQQRGLIIKERSDMNGGLWLYGGSSNGGVGSRGAIGVGLGGDNATTLVFNTSASMIRFWDGDIQFRGQTGLTAGTTGTPTLLGTISSAGQLQLPTTGSSAGLLLGGDVQLYRNAANELRLNSGSSFTVDGSYFAVLNASSSTATVFASRATGQAQNPFRIGANGTFSWGNGTDAADTALYRGAANRLDLASGDSFNIVNGNLRFGTTSTGILDANSNEMLILSATSSAVNHIQIRNNATGLFPSLTAVGDDTNIGFDISSKGSGSVRFWANNSSTFLAQFNSSGKLQLTTQGSGGGIELGGDFHLYRLAADFGYTPDTLQVGGAFQVDGIAYFPSTGSGGGLRIGGDTNLYRSAADVLATSDSFQVGGDILASLAPTSTAVTQAITTVDSPGTVGQYSSIAIGTDGLPVISYYDSTNSDLKLAKCTDAACTASTLVVVAPDGLYTSIAIGTDGNPVISYFEHANQDLKVTHCTAADCSTSVSTTLDSTGSVGLYTSIAIGTDGLPVISYQNGTSADLKVAKCTNAACTASTITTLDSTGSVGEYTAIAIGVDGLPVISYYDATNTDLKVVHCGNQACSSGNVISTPLTTGIVSGAISMVIGADGLPIISHVGSSTTASVFKCSDILCSAGTRFTIHNTTNTGTHNSITIGADGLPIVSYYDDNSDDLLVVKCGNSSCSAGNTQTTIDSTGSVGQHTAITIGTDGLPVISYYDVTNTALKLTKCGTPSCSGNGHAPAAGSNIGSLSNYFNNVYANQYWGKSFSIANFDLAEEYYSADELTPGAIVSVYSGEEGRVDQVQQSSTPYEDTLMGIVSTQPGITLADWQQQDRTGMYPIALAGRVPVKVSNENGPIKPGDAITSSSVPGIGMKATQAGRIVGIALSGFENQENSQVGTVTVFVNPTWWSPSESGLALLQEPDEKEGEQGSVQQVVQAVATSIEGLATATVDGVKTFFFDGALRARGAFAGLFNVSSERIASFATSFISSIRGEGDIFATTSELRQEASADGTGAVQITTYSVQSSREEIMISGTGMMRECSDYRAGGASGCNAVAGKLGFATSFASDDVAGIVAFAPEFSALLDEGEEVRVIVTPTDELFGTLYVAEKSVRGFVVGESITQDAGVTFDWIIIARIGEGTGVGQIEEVFAQNEVIEEPISNPVVPPVDGDSEGEPTAPGAGENEETPTDEAADIQEPVVEEPTEGTTQEAPQGTAGEAGEDNQTSTTTQESEGGQSQGSTDSPPTAPTESGQADNTSTP